LRYNATYAGEQLALWRAGQYSMYDYTSSGYTFLNWAKALSSATSNLLTLA
jgi:hypothetical protein